MDPLTITVLVTTTLSTFAALCGIWLRGRVRRQRSREDSRRDHLRHLPPGSRVIDLGGRGIVIEVGAPASRRAQRDDRP